ncbi:unannotated protein [freshwater metagenome]|uniref:Unannotated protein n=1 Tax=freshwater metagenome TaxID=449393 RepID=A0A6J7TV80_9ZZZZ
MELITSIALALAAIILGAALIAYGVSDFRRKGRR